MSEAADERLLEEIRARRKASNQTKAKQQAIAAQETYTESAQGINEQLVETRARRQFLKVELAKTRGTEVVLLRKAERASVMKSRVGEMDRAKRERERERKRRAALEGRKKTVGAKPRGVTKVGTLETAGQKAPVGLSHK